MSSHQDFEESSSCPSQSEPLQDDEIQVRDSAESEELYFLPFVNSRRSREDSNGSAILEAGPLLRRPSIYLDHTKSNISCGTVQGPTSGSDDGGSIHDDDSEPLVRVQSGVKKVEAITMLWTKKSLIVAYVR